MEPTVTFNTIDDLIAYIKANIKTNTSRDITEQVMNNVLCGISSFLGVLNLPSGTITTEKIHGLAFGENLSGKSVIDSFVELVTPASSTEEFTMQVTEGGIIQLQDSTTKAIINPATSVINLTLQLPNNPSPGQMVKIVLGGTIIGGSPVITNVLNIISPNVNYPILYPLAPDMVYAGDTVVFEFINNVWFNFL